jgi:DNA segregation ATPase FtsK/SpoIIIE, S-DNA-T family
MATNARTLGSPLKAGPMKAQNLRTRDDSRQRGAGRQRNIRQTGLWTDQRRAVFGRILRWLIGLCLVGAALAVFVAMGSYDPLDPSMNTATDRPPVNLLGGPGAFLSALLLQWWGVGALALPLTVMAWGARMIVSDAKVAWKRRLLVAAVAMIVLAVAAGGWIGPASLQISDAMGGGIGLIADRWIDRWMAGAGWSAYGWIIPTLCWVIGLALLAYAMGFRRSDIARLGNMPLPSLPRRAAAEPLAWDDEPEAVARPARGLREANREKPGRVEPLIGNTVAERMQPKVSKPKPAPTPPRTRQEKLALGDVYALPSMDLLNPGQRKETAAIDPQALVQNARLLESILEDFGVQGEIPQVHPGPVVTLYELEPAPGIKASRVIGLADDIARSMSSISARVAVVPGRNVIGIELPNRNRETVFLRELLTSDAFEAHKGALPLVLGKDLSGEPVIADLAPMPHLLIAGTTGSGKSVGLNAMILSLLYRLTPDQCRMIMIDPKMLELSVYDNIPHLLAPVVTEPKTAIVALKWAVKEMDDRYRKMSKLAVRNLAAFNDKVGEAKAKNRKLLRRVQTGFDPETGEPVYEDQTFDFEPMPLIVVVVDELADLMMVAGKDIEQLVQRLAQKARAAGIHLIMATQRPSVDVITGVIKANLPTRVSFQVTSKIDSRTILGEQGAEQLLGKGDMLYMQGGKQIIRVHGPLVSDEEVERVADFWRGQGRPDYVDAVTADPEEDGGFDDIMGGGDGDDLYRRAVELVAREQKASTSFIQRHLAIGYNRAARIVDQMEKASLVGPPNHVGKREVLIDPDGNRIG